MSYSLYSFNRGLYRGVSQALLPGDTRSLDPKPYTIGDTTGETLGV